MMSQTEQKNKRSPIHSSDRRNFLRKAASVAAAAIPLEPLLGGKPSQASASVVDYDSENRTNTSFAICTNTASSERVDVGEQPDNGDAIRFTDFSGSYSKASLHDGLGVPNAHSWLSLKNALTKGKFSDFENIIVGTQG